MSNKVFNVSDLPKVGVMFGKFFPPHRGHLNSIIQASTQVQKLYVVVSYHKGLEEQLCKEAGIKPIPLALRKQWLSKEVIDMPHIKIKSMDESNFPEYPNGWQEWTDLMKETIGEHIDVFFMGEQEYADYLPKYFPDTKCVVYDPDRKTFPISATKIRSNPYKYWNFMLGSVRPYFAKKVLITGTESSAKTTLTKCLAKIYNTSWSEEYGRYYAERFLGGSEEHFVDEDFTRIAHLQVEQDYQALHNSNKICFFDTDATVTQYYSELYVGHKNDIVEKYIDSSKYDVVFLMKPDVQWVDDGMRLNGEQQRRVTLYNKLKQMYINHGFTNIVEVGGTYNERLNFVVNYINNKFTIN